LDAAQVKRVTTNEGLYLNEGFAGI
jgi:hypothetical protein